MLCLVQIMVCCPPPVRTAEEKMALECLHLSDLCFMEKGGYLWGEILICLTKLYFEVVGHFLLYLEKAVYSSFDLLTWTKLSKIFLIP